MQKYIVWTLIREYFIFPNSSSILGLKPFYILNGNTLNSPTNIFYQKMILKKPGCVEFSSKLWHPSRSPHSAYIRSTGGTKNLIFSSINQKKYNSGREGGRIKTKKFCPETYCLHTVDLLNITKGDSSLCGIKKVFTSSL